jgi:hypothetical protein
MAFEDIINNWSALDTPPPDMSPSSPLLQGPGAYPGKPGTPTILSTSYRSIPISGSEGKAWDPPDETLPADATTTLRDNPPGRILKAAAEGWKGTAFLTPEARAAAESGPAGFFGRFTNPIATLEELPFKAAGALGGGLVQGAYEAGSAIDPALGRALATLAIVSPGAEVGVPPRIPARSMGLPYGFRDYTDPLPPDAFPRPSPDVVAKTSDRPVGAERIPPEMPTSWPNPRKLTADDIGTVMDARYGNVTKSSDVTSADAVNRAVDLAVPQSESDLMRRQFGKDSVVAKHLDNLDALRDKPLSVQAWKGADQALTDDIYSPSIDPSAARQLRVIQNNLRGSLEQPVPGDLISGDGTGYENLQAARQAAQQHAKMQAVEAISKKSGLRVNEPQSVRSQVATFLSNDSNTVGWSPAEIEALKHAQTTSDLYDLVHSLGSRLGVGVSTGGALAGAIASGDPMAFLGVPAAGALAWGVGAVPRAVENMVVRQRMKNALNILGQSVPLAPLDTSLPSPVRAPTIPDTRFMTYPTVGARPPQ